MFMHTQHTRSFFFQHLNAYFDWLIGFEIGADQSHIFYTMDKYQGQTQPIGFNNYISTSYYKH